MNEEKIVEIMADYIKKHDVPKLIELVLKAIERVGAE